MPLPKPLYLTSAHRRMALALGLIALSVACDGGGKEDEPLSAEDALNAWLRAQYPDGHAPAPPSADIVDNEAALGEDPPRTALFPDQVLTSVIDYQTDDPVQSFCMSFGSPEEGWCIPVTDPDVTQTGDDTDGSLQLSVQMPPELCTQLSQICHDIKCYEFAETSAGTFTAANVAFLAAACGNCDEPSCRDLIVECTTGGYCLTDAECANDQMCVQGTCVGVGDLTFSVTWSALADVDLYVTTPGGLTISYSSPTGDGGILDVDDTLGGPGAVENIFFDGPEAGTYSVWVNHFGGDPASFTLDVRGGRDSLLSVSGSVSADNVDSETWTVDYAP